jgi:hypothetical protein
MINQIRVAYSANLTQINKSFVGINSSMNTKYLAVVAALAVMLVASTALATTDDAFAGKKGYKKSQAVSQVNNCGNGDSPIDVFCQNLASQVQGDENAPALAGAQGFD